MWNKFLVDCAIDDYWKIRANTNFNAALDINLREFFCSSVIWLSRISVMYLILIHLLVANLTNWNSKQFEKQDSKQLNRLPFLTVDKFDSYFHSNQVAFPLKHLYGSCVLVRWTAWVKSRYSRTSFVQYSTINEDNDYSMRSASIKSHTNKLTHSFWVRISSYIFFFANMNLSTSVWKHTASQFARVQFIKSLWTR